MLVRVELVGLGSERLLDLLGVGTLVDAQHRVEVAAAAPHLGHPSTVGGVDLPPGLFQTASHGLTAGVETGGLFVIGKGFLVLALGSEHVSPIKIRLVTFLEMLAIYSRNCQFEKKKFFEFLKSANFPETLPSKIVNFEKSSL